MSCRDHQDLKEEFIAIGMVIACILGVWKFCEIIGWLLGHVNISVS